MPRKAPLIQQQNPLTRPRKIVSSRAAGRPGTNNHNAISRKHPFKFSPRQTTVSAKAPCQFQTQKTEIRPFVMCNIELICLR